MNRTTRVLTLFAVAGLSLNVAAEGSEGYLGGSIGLANHDLDVAGLLTGLTAAGLTSTVTSDDKDLAGKAFAGYRFNQYLGVEIGYMFLGTSKLDINVTAPAATTATAESSLSGFTAFSVFSYPVLDRTSLFAKAGLFVSDADLDAVVNSSTDLSAKSNGTDFMFGLGGRVDVTDNISVRAEWERALGVSTSDPDLFSLGVEFRF